MIPGRNQTPDARRRAGVGSISRERKCLQRNQLTTISEIRFDYRPGQPGRTDVHRTMPRIDTIPLTDLIDTFEICAGMEPAGEAYGGLVPLFFRFESAIDHFHGHSSLMRQKTPSTCLQLRGVGLLAAADAHKPDWRPCRVGLLRAALSHHS